MQILPVHQGKRAKGRPAKVTSARKFLKQHPHGDTTTSTLVGVDVPTAATKKKKKRRPLRNISPEEAAATISLSPQQLPHASSPQRMSMPLFSPPEASLGLIYETTADLPHSSVRSTSTAAPVSATTSGDPLADLVPVSTATGAPLADVRISATSSHCEAPLADIFEAVQGIEDTRSVSKRLRIPNTTIGEVTTLTKRARSVD